MTENEAKEILENDSCYECSFGTSFGASECKNKECEVAKATIVAIQALEEIQQYRAIGTVEELKTMKENGSFSGVELAQLAAMQMRLRDYQAIGTAEECRNAVAIVKKMYEHCEGSCDGCPYHNPKFDKCMNDLLRVSE